MPGVPATCDGQVYHRRLSPTVHEFCYPVSYVWLDPDAPGDLCRHHPLWSASRPAPARFNAGDYGNGSDSSLTTKFATSWPWSRGIDLTARSGC